MNKRETAQLLDDLVRFVVIVAASPNLSPPDDPDLESWVDREVFTSCQHEEIVKSARKLIKQHHLSKWIVGSEQEETP